MGYCEKRCHILILRCAEGTRRDWVLHWYYLWLKRPLWVNSEGILDWLLILPCVTYVLTHSVKSVNTPLCHLCHKEELCHPVSPVAKKWHWVLRNENENWNDHKKIFGLTSLLWNHTPNLNSKGSRRRFKTCGAVMIFLWPWTSLRGQIWAYWSQSEKIG